MVGELVGDPKSLIKEVLYGVHLRVKVPAVIEEAKGSGEASQAEVVKEMAQLLPSLRSVASQHQHQHQHRIEGHPGQGECPLPACLH